MEGNLGNSNHDVIVGGGGTAGTVAAIAAARAGAKTLLIERNGCLGGAATMRNVSTWCGLHTLGETPRQVIHGIAGEVLERLERLGGLGPIMRFRGVFVPFDGEALKFVLDELAGEAGVEVLFGSFVSAARRDAGRLAEVTLATHGGPVTRSARAFVDATGEGDLAAFGGASTRYGNADGINLGTLGTRFGGILADVTVTAEDLITAIAAQGFAPGTITKDRCVTVRLPGSNDLVLYLASADYDPRNPVSMSGAEADARRQAWSYLKAIRTIPGCEGAYLASTGPEIGTRESRHLNCRHHLTWDDIAARRSFEDCIALGAWGAEWHDRDSWQSAFDYPADKGAYEIPLSCLHSVDTENLFCAGRLADGDRKAGAAIRVMGTGMATGQAAGISAALVAEGRFAPETVRAQLRAGGAALALSDLPEPV
ncbi:MAG: FAD-dependent oxidoreductase [Sulfitobacter sp.]|nr:FAD-dependent oxidoreductase [Sulfitobacter sp.]